MSLTPFQRHVCQLLAHERKRSRESYVAGAAALNEVLHAPRVSHDVDLFHDTQTSLLASWQSDRVALERNGLRVKIMREYAAFVEVEVAGDDGAVVLQWVQDSVYRFFPLMEHPDFGLTLHPFDLAVNKVLALVGRVEARDWIDTITCHTKLQPLGYLVWAACGKDPGLTPDFILAQASRSTHYSSAELNSLAFETQPPDPVALGNQWREMLAQATEIMSLLPESHIGQCVINKTGDLYTGTPEHLRDGLESNQIAFHPGCIRGAWPRVAT